MKVKERRGIPNVLKALWGALDEDIKVIDESELPKDNTKKIEESIYGDKPKINKKSFDGIRVNVDGKVSIPEKNKSDKGDYREDI